MSVRQIVQINVEKIIRINIYRDFDREKFTLNEKQFSKYEPDELHYVNN